MLCRFGSIHYLLSRDCDISDCGYNCITTAHLRQCSIARPNKKQSNQFSKPPPNAGVASYPPPHICTVHHIFHSVMCAVFAFPHLHFNADCRKKYESRYPGISIGWSGPEAPADVHSRSYTPMYWYVQVPVVSLCVPYLLGTCGRRNRICGTSRSRRSER